MLPVSEDDASDHGVHLNGLWASFDNSPVEHSRHPTETHVSQGHITRCTLEQVSQMEEERLSAVIGTHHLTLVVERAAFLPSTSPKFFI